MSPFRSKRGRRPAALLTMIMAAALAATMSGPAGARPADPDPIVSQYRTDKVSLVMVNAPTRDLRNEVIALGLDYTEHATNRGIEVVLHGSADAKTLRDAGFTWRTTVADLRAEMRQSRLADKAYDAKVKRSPLPSGRTAYRTYPQYVSDLRRLAGEYPYLTKPLTLARETVLGRPIRGLEISTNADRVRDGKPVFLLMGAHHAREWPSAEHAIEFAFDLLQGHRAGDNRARRILSQERVIIVPVVNVDGFIISRNADPLGDFSTFDYEMKRKNCSISENTPAQYRGGTCADNPAGRLRGTDLNRNYPGFWGGGGASPTWSSDTYRGDDPGSEPETDAVRTLISRRAVTVLISNHTFSNLVLRPPAIADVGRPPDEPQYKALGDAMAAANGYTSQASYQLYDTSGSTEDWSYWNTGGYGFTFEIGTEGFHPEFEPGVVAEYLGLEPADGAGLGGNREAYYRAAQAALDTAQHARIRGTAPPGYLVQVRKRFISQTSDVIDTNGEEGLPRYYEDTLSTQYVSKGGAFTMHVNPSTRPLIVGRYGRDPVAPPQEGLVLTNPAGVPQVGGTEEVTFEIEGPPDADNGRAVLSFAWPNGADWDFFVEDPSGAVVASGATLANPEVITVPDPVPGTYTVVANNFAGGSATDDWSGEVTFRGPEPATYSGLKETWYLTCVNRRGRTVDRQPVVVDRGRLAFVGAACNPRGNKR